MYARCWLSTEFFALQGAVLIPLTFILFINLCICIRVAVFVYQLSRRSATPSSPGGGREMYRYHVTVTLKAVVVLLPILGLPWVFGFLSSE